MHYLGLDGVACLYFKVIKGKKLFFVLFLKLFCKFELLSFKIKKEYLHKLRKKKIKEPE